LKAVNALLRKVQLRSTIEDQIHGQLLGYRQAAREWRESQRGRFARPKARQIARKGRITRVGAKQSYRRSNG
jgi:hypothetical protein